MWFGYTLKLWSSSHFKTDWPFDTHFLHSPTSSDLGMQPWAHQACVCMVFHVLSHPHCAHQSGPRPDSAIKSCRKGSEECAKVLILSPRGLCKATANPQAHLPVNQGDKQAWLAASLCGSESNNQAPVTFHAGFNLGARERSGRCVRTV